MKLPNRPRILPFLNLVKLLLVLLMVVMFIQFNARIAQNQAATHAIAQSTNNVVKGQADILKAIKDVTDDTHTTAAQQTAIIICMLQVPVSERTTDLQAQCRAQSKDAATDGSASQTGGSAASNPSPSKTPTSPSSSASAPATPQSSSSVSSSPQSAPSTPTKQATFLQRIINDINPFN